MIFLRRRETTLMGAAMFGVVWTMVNALFSVFSEGSPRQLSSGVFIAAFLALFGVLLGPPEERRRRRELRREAKMEMRRA